MEQNFQTSFIPKKTIIKDRIVSARPVSFITIVSFFIFFTALVGTGSLYFYKEILDKNITEMGNTLIQTRNRFEPAKIEELQALDNRLNSATDILSRHVAVTPIFEALEKITMKTVRFTSFNYTLPNESNGRISIKMGGVAIGYRSIALQADLFTQNKNFIDPVFANLRLDDKGNVIFDLDFLVDPSFVNYKRTLLTENVEGL